MRDGEYTETPWTDNEIKQILLDHINEKLKRQNIRYVDVVGNMTITYHRNGQPKQLNYNVSTDYEDEDDYCGCRRCQTQPYGEPIPRQLTEIEHPADDITQTLINKVESTERPYRKALEKLEEWSAIVTTKTDLHLRYIQPPQQ